MDRREALRNAAVGALLIMFGPQRAAAKVHYLNQVDESLWGGINRDKPPGQETHLETVHVPVIKAPVRVEAGEVFAVEIEIGRQPHPMGPAHWIEYLQFNVGNEPAGNVLFRSRGYVKAASKFDTVLGSGLKGQTISLIAQIKCNLHGIWENHVNIEVV